MSPNTPPPIPTDNYGYSLPNLLPEPRSCSAGSGVKWLTEAATLFKQRWLLWVGIGLFYLALIMVTQLSEYTSFIISLLSIIFMAGFIQGAATQATGGELKFGHLFAGFKTHFFPLIILILLYCLALFILVIIAVLFVAGLSSTGTAFADLGQYGESQVLEIIGLSLLMILMIIPAIMSIFFAPALVVLHDVKPLKAMEMSFKGCLKNIAPIIVYLIVGTIVFLVGSVITLAVGVVALIPIFMITYYTSYRDVWTDQPVS
ncbi:BPSS1780 family membrane protein [Psychrobacter phenylpyruvicus]|uniref:Predicted integral membrane protein n=1 Tax=Psychrobacter phenylpyruvicus TaxID=29432 RepID=A0A379LH22_9GAMM|nr:BPSS1780 family membrane protein [Psychrobacter phenylpyruvicus]SUD89899.1 Predicted integral membrane protein [Psychrobacter phenylpyruvicus]